MLFDTAPHSDLTQLLRFTDSPLLPRPIPRDLHSHRRFFRLEPTPLRSSKQTYQRRPRPGAPSPRFSLSTSSSSASNQLKWDWGYCKGMGVVGRVHSLLVLVG